MPELFDDLIPTKEEPEGQFDDLIPAGEESTGLFDDLVPKDALGSRLGQTGFYRKKRAPFFDRSANKRRTEFVPLYGNAEGRREQERLFRPLTDEEKNATTGNVSPVSGRPVPDSSADTARNFLITQERQNQLLKSFEAGLLDDKSLSKPDRDLIMEGYRNREKAAMLADDPAIHEKALEKYQAAGQELGVGVIGPVRDPLAEYVDPVLKKGYEGVGAAGGAALDAVNAVVGKPIRRGMSVFGAGTADAMTILSNVMHDGEPLPVNNLIHFAENPDDPTLPIDRHIASLGDEDKWTRRGGKLAMVTAEMIPFLGVMELAPAAAQRGMLPSAVTPQAAAAASPYIAGATFGLNEDGSVNPVGVLAAAGIPVVDKYARTMTAKVLQDKLRKTYVRTTELTPGNVTTEVLKRYPMLEKEIVQKVAETAAGQGAVFTFLTGIHVPGVLASDDPAGAFEDLIVSNVALAATAGFGVGRKGESYTKAEMKSAINRGELPFIWEHRTLNPPPLIGKPGAGAPPGRRAQAAARKAAAEMGLGPSAAGKPVVTPQAVPGKVEVPKPELPKPGPFKEFEVEQAPAPTAEPAAKPTPTAPEPVEGAEFQRTLIEEGVVLGEGAEISAAKEKVLDSAYAWVPIDSLQASHTGPEFSENEQFAPLKNTRDYAKDQAERDKVLLAAKNWRPNDYITWGASAATGPVMVSRGSDGTYRVLGGNGRLQAMKLLSETQWDVFGEQMEAHASKFGLSERPSDRHVLSRVLNPTDVASKEGVAAANDVVDLLNPSPGVVQTPPKMAVADAEAIPPETVAQLDVPATNAAQTQGWIKSRIEGGEIDRNTRVQLLESPSAAEDYVSRLQAQKAYQNEVLVEYYRNQSKPVTIREGVVEKAMPLALELRAKGGGEMADAVSAMVLNVAQVQDKFPDRSLGEVLQMVYEQGQMAETGAEKLGRTFAAAIRQQLVYDKGGKRVSAAPTLDNLTEFWNSMTNSMRQYEPGAMDMFAEGGQRTVLDPVKDFLRVRIGDNMVVEEPGGEFYRVNPDPRVKRARDLRKKSDKEKLTARENEEMDRLEAELGQDFFEFYEAQEAKEARDKAILEKEQADQKAELEARAKKRLVADEITTQEDLFGEPGQMTLMDSGQVSAVEAAKLAKNLTRIDSDLNNALEARQEAIFEGEGAEGAESYKSVLAEDAALRDERAETLRQIQKAVEPFGITKADMERASGAELEGFFNELSKFDNVRDFVDAELASIKSEGTSALQSINRKGIKATTKQLEALQSRFPSRDVVSDRAYPMGANLQAGLQAVSNVAALGPSDARLRLLDSRIREGVQTPEGWRVVGQNVRSSDETALVMQAMRSPRQETFWVVPTLRDKVVQVRGVTTRQPNATAINTPDFYSVEYVRDLISSGKADGFWVVHNHPSGQVKPSSGDIQTTKYFAADRFGLNDWFSGHIVIDHGKYSLIDSKGKVTEHELKQITAQPDPLLKEQGDRPVFTPADVAWEATQIKPGKRHLGVVFFDSQHQVRAMAELDVSGVSSQMDFDNLVGELRTMARDNGAVGAFGYYDARHNTPVPMIREVATELVANDVLTDLAWQPPKGAAVGVREAMEMPAVANDVWFGMEQQAARDVMQVREDEAKAPEPEGPVVKLQHRKGKAPQEIREQLGGLEHIKHLKYPEVYRLVTELMGSAPQVKKLRGNVRGLFVGDKLGPQIFMDREVFKDPAQAARTLMHEVGHWIDYLPEGTLKRGNVLGRLASLRDFLKSTFPMTKKAGPTLTTKDRNKLRNEARRSVGPRPAKDNEADLAAWNKEVSERYQKLVDSEIDARGLARVDEVRAELWELSKYWRPMPASAPEWYIKYRESSKELYADMVSVLFNAPGYLQEVAPVSYGMFWEYLDAKPQIKAGLLDLQRFLSTGIERVIERRRSEVQEMFEKGDAGLIRAWDEAEARATSFEGWWLHTKQSVYDQNEAILSLTRTNQTAKERGAKIRDYLEQMVMTDNENSRMLQRIHRDVVLTLDEHFLPTSYIGEWMMYKRIAYDRDDVANPLGHTPQSAQENLAGMRREVGAIKAGALDWMAERFRMISMDTIKEAVRVGSYNRENFFEKIVPNNHYAAFAVSEYVEKQGYVPAGLKPVLGTHKGVLNPWEATVLKLMSLNNLNNLQRTKNEFISFMSNTFPKDIEQAKTFWTDQGHRPHPPGPGKGHIMVLRNGKPLWFEVDEQIARVFTYERATDLERTLKLALDTPFRKVFYPLWISKNPGFHAVNLMRDFQRTARNLQIGMPTLAMDYVKAFWPSFMRAMGKNHPMIDEMVANYAIGPLETTFIKTAGYGPDADRAKTDRQMLERYRILPMELKGTPSTLKQAWNVVDGVGRALEAAGVINETMPKVAGYKRLRIRGNKPDEAAPEVREYAGTPNITRKGRDIMLGRPVMPFWNMFIRGYTADGKKATDPKTAADWWFRMGRVNIGWGMLTAMAVNGLLGEWLKEVFRGMSEYARTNYNNIPLGTVNDKDAEEGKKSAYLQIPRDETARLIGAWAYKMTDGVIKSWKGKDMTALHQTLAEVLGVGAGEMPGVNPIIKLAKGWGQYVSGRNPHDPHWGRPVIPAREFRVGGWDSHKYMLKWSYNQTGLQNWVRYDPDNNSTLEIVTDAIPVANRFIRISDRGHVEERIALEGAEQIHRDKLFMSMPDNAKRLRTEMYRLRSYGSVESGNANPRTKAQDDRYQELMEWHGTFYSSSEDMIEMWQERGNKARADTERRRLERATKSYE